MRCVHLETCHSQGLERVRTCPWLRILGRLFTRHCVFVCMQHSSNAHRALP